MPWYVYILRCRDGSLYTGATTDVARRLREHRMGTGAKYTRGRAPVTLVFRQRFLSKSRAMRREAEIKQWDRNRKLSLVTQHSR